MAAALKVRPSHLLEQAGYASPAIVSFAQPFPVDKLDADTFERFVEFLLQALYRGRAEVRRAGSTGHKQDGLDLTVTFPDGTRDSYQCKRVQQFGPAEVAKAVAAHAATANKKVLVLSRVPSPQAQDAMRLFPGWDLWGKEDLSRLIRTELSADDQNRLVDIFFRGQRLALLGRSEPGPWLTMDEFFDPFVGRRTIFDHDLGLKGREADIASLSDSLRAKDTPLVLLTGPGGIGKSRLLKDGLEALAKAHPLAVVRLLSSDRDATRENIEALGDGPKILVIDDAHDRDGLAGLMQYVAVPENQTRLLLATRLYAVSRIKREAAVAAIENPPTIELKPLSMEQSTELAKEVLADAGAPVEWAEGFVKATRDSPLVTVMAARVIAKEGISFEAAKNADALRNLILGKFEKVVIGDLGSPGDEEAIKGMLDVLALVQPFHVEDSALIALLNSLKGIDPVKGSRLFKLLVDGGVIYRRGHHYRLMPDLLGDYLLEQSCIGAEGKLSAFALLAFDQVEARQLENVLVNLGRMDWRLKGGDPSESGLLDSVWHKLRNIHDPHDPRIEAIRAVAIYQPKQALDFVIDRIRQGVLLREFPKILRNIAYNYDYLPDACEVLWAIGRDDQRELGPHPEHAIRLLSELCGFEERKPLLFSQKVFEFGMALAARDDVWDFRYSPLDIMRPILSAEGITTRSTGRNITMTPFLVDPDIVKPLRARFVARILELVEHPRLRVAKKAAVFIANALHYPTGMMGGAVPREVRQKYEVEFEQTLLAIRDLLSNGRIHPVVATSIAKSISWHAQHGVDGVQVAAKAVLLSLPSTLEFRFLAALSEGWENVLDRRGYGNDWQERREAWLTNLSAELKAAYTPTELHRKIEDALGELADSGEERTSAHVLIAQLMRDDLALARVFVSDARAHPESHTRPFLAYALHELLVAEPAEGQALAQRFLESTDEILARAAAGAFSGMRRAYDERDITLIGAALGSHNAGVVASAITALWTLRSTDHRLLIDLAKKIHFEIEPRLAEDVFMLFTEAANSPTDQLTTEDADHFLKRLINIPQLSGYWVQQFLSSLSLRFPQQLADFLFARVEIAVTTKSFSFHPANHGPYIQVPLRLRETSQGPQILAQAWNWLRDHGNEGDFYFQHHSADVFDAMFGGDAEGLLSFFEGKLETASASELTLMSSLLRKASPEFIFVNRAFVVRFLERCAAISSDFVERAIGDLADSAESGVRSGIPGEPFPRDIDHRDRAKEALKQIPRLSPAYELYEYIRKSAEAGIERSRREGEAMDAEE